MRIAILIFLVYGVSSFLVTICHAGHSKSQVADQSYTFEGIGFRDKTSRSRKTLTSKYPEAAGGRKNIDDKGKKTYEVKVSSQRTLRARYHDGILYELILESPRLQSSYKKLSRQFGEPDRAASRGRGFEWKLDNMRITLQVGQSKEVVTFHDTKYLDAVKQMAGNTQN